MYKNDKMIDSTIKIFDQNIFGKQKTQLLKFLESHLKNSSAMMKIMTPNPEQIVMANKQKTFAKALASADILIPDGIGLVIASEFLNFFKPSDYKAKIEERISGVDLVKDLLKVAISEKYKVLVIGGKNYENKNLQSESGELKDLAFGDGRLFWCEFTKNVENITDDELKTLREQIKKIKPNMVFVALGAPYQEKFIVENADFFSKLNISLIMAVGGSFDFLVGNVKRAPFWFRETGLEWLFRLFVEPWRFFRQLKLVEFVGLVLREVW